MIDSLRVRVRARVGIIDSLRVMVRVRRCKQKCRVIDISNVAFSS